MTASFSFKVFSTITKKNKRKLRIESKAVKNNLFLYPFNLFFPILHSYSQSSIKRQNFRWNLLFVRWYPEKIFPTDCISEKNISLALLHGYKRTSTTRVNKNEVDFLNFQAVHAIIEPGLPLLLLGEDLSKEESLAGYHRRARDPPSHEVSRKPRVHRVTRKKLCTRSKTEKGMAFKSYRLRH